MRFIRSSFVAALVALAAVVGVPTMSAAQQVESLQAKPLSESETLRGVTLKPVKAGPLRVPTITWPGDVATIYAESEGLFKAEGLNVVLFNENDLAKQVKGFIEGDTPLLRGTMGMINAASEAAAKAGVNIVVIYQLTWSNGGDVLVVRQGINSLSDLRGKNVAVQLYGPHMDFLTTALKQAGLKPSDVNITWMRELTIPTYDPKGKLVDPRSAFAGSTQFHAATVISPDGAALTSGGAEGVKGAKALFSSKSANRVIADVYAVRADYFNAHRAEIQKFTHALMVGQERFVELLNNKAGNQAKFNALMSKSATLLFGSPQATKDVEGSLADAEYVDFNDNAVFFNGTGTTRNFATLTDEIQGAFVPMGIMNGKIVLRNAGWDYPQLAAGIKNPGAAGTAGVAAAPSATRKPAFDATKTQKAVEKQIATELSTFHEAGSLYSFEIRFAPSQSSFSSTQYRDEFKKALEMSQTFGGALVIVEGHNSPDALNQARKDGKSATEIAMIEQAAKNLSYNRAVAVRKAYLDYAKTQGIVVDESQFVAVGLGVKDPKFPVPANEAEWNANRRVTFRIKAVETELDSFRPIK